MTLSDTNTVRIVPLGGLGEIGLNLMVIECDRDAIVIDAGVMFAADRETGGARLRPDLRYLEQRGLNVRAIFLTHGHEDHIGALPYLLQSFPAPIFATPVTAAFVRRTLAAAAFEADLRMLVPRAPIAAGPFTVEALRVTHSTPDAVALAVRTPAGTIVHSGDFKIDPSPVDGMPFDAEGFAQLGAEGVALLLSDSTNAERDGHSGAESSLKPLMSEVVRRARGKCVLTAFSSHLHRIRQFTEAAHEVGRYVVPLGRRMAESVRLGVETGQLNFPPGTFISPQEADFIESRRLAMLAGGSQGEPLSALSRLAAGTHPVAQVGTDDLIVLSSRFIPGNERAIQTVINQLFKRGAEVLYDGVATVHVSGHAYREELAELIRLVRPRCFVPIHGEYRHLVHHQRVARAAGMAEADCFLLENGEPLLLTRGGARKGRKVPAGRCLAEELQAAAAGALEEYRDSEMAPTVFAIVGISGGDGRIVNGPDLVIRGMSERSAGDLGRARAELRTRLQALNGYLRFDPARIRAEMTRALRAYFLRDGRRPVIVPYVLEV